MHILKFLVTLALVSSQAFAITCKPKLGTGTKTYDVSAATAKSEAKAAGLRGNNVSGFPHRFFNSEGLKFGVAHCDRKGSILLEYPIYESKNKAKWDKNVKKGSQKGGETPIRVVFANASGASKYCGVMVHKEVDKQNNALNKNFQTCS
ncbi:unnamed protein product [Clonostachys rosea]|uniref:Uncharacterized protein n=1 Tax=Bionectria ochroleuca TaxID=29856 RepID=A0ABY6U641_BIOOC|nr:unnamed protein product [Clonostachys rosea]